MQIIFRKNKSINTDFLNYILFLSLKVPGLVVFYHSISQVYSLGTPAQSRDIQFMSSIQVSVLTKKTMILIVYSRITTVYASEMFRMITA